MFKKSYSRMGKLKIAILLFVIALVLIAPGSALWTIQDPDYSGYVVFNADMTGYAYVQYGPFAVNYTFTYEQTGKDLYVAHASWLTSKYNVPFGHQGNTVTSPMFPESSLEWI
jgi:hypothetical protein